MIADEIRSLSSLINPKASQDKIQQIQLSDITADPNQPRKNFDEASLKELAASITLYGVLQPIGVREIEDDRYVIVFGERRYRASIIAQGIYTIPAFIVESTDATVQIIENIQRHDLEPHEISRWIQERLENGETSASIAQRLGKSKDYVSMYKSFASMPDYLQSLYDRGLCSSVKSIVTLQRHAKNNEAQVREFCEQVVEPMSQSMVNDFVNLHKVDTSDDQPVVKETAAVQEPRQPCSTPNVVGVRKGVIVRIEGTDLIGFLDLKAASHNNTIRVLIDDTPHFFDKDALRIQDIVT